MGLGTAIYSTTWAPLHWAGKLKKQTKKNSYTLEIFDGKIDPNIMQCMIYSDCFSAILHASVYAVTWEL